MKRMQNKKHYVSEDEWESCKKYFDYKCAYCGIDESKAKTLQGQYFHKEHVDHNGANDLSNCVPACRSCNSKKWEFSFEYWYDSTNAVFDEARYNKILDWLNRDYKLFIRQI